MRRHKIQDGPLVFDLAQQRAKITEELINGYSRKRIRRQIDSAIRSTCVIIIAVGLISSVFFLAKSWGLING